MAIRSLKSGSFSRSTQVGNSIILPGDYESIATVYLSSGNQTNITFSSIPSTFTHLQLRLFARETAAGVQNNEWMRFNSDSGSNYAWHELTGNGTSAAASSQSATTAMKAVSYIAGSSATTNVFGCAVIDILDYANTSKYKTVRSLTGSDNNGAGVVALTSGLWMSTSAVTSLSLIVTDFARYSHAALYGIRG